MSITREQGQAMVGDAYRKNSFVLALFATGFGKAKAALDAVCSRQWRRGLIIAHSESARDITWPAEIDKWCPDIYAGGRELVIMCYPSLKNIQYQDFDWVIADEAHYITNHNYVFFQRNKIKSLILLTATLPEDLEKQQLLRSLCKGHILQITLDDAVNSGVLNNYQITVWRIGMTPIERSAYLKHCDNVKHAMSTGNKNFIHLRTGERMRFIYNLESKYRAGIYLRDQIRQLGRRNIIFCGSIEMANRLSEYRYHSQVSDLDFIRFKNQEINELASIKQIQEGANIPNLESALVIQLNSKQLNIIQKLGRLMRLPEGKTAKMHILVARDSVDENWAYKALRDLDKTRITYRDLDPELYLLPNSDIPQN